MVAAKISLDPIGRALESPAARWNREHPLEPAWGSACPACAGETFYVHPETLTRWSCFSFVPDHPGELGPRGYAGDALTLAAHQRGITPEQVIAEDAPPGAPVIALDSIRRPLRSRSYLTAVTILEENARDVLGSGVRLWLNEMTGRIEIGTTDSRAALIDADVSTFRARIEARFPGGKDRDQNETGLQLSIADLHAACEQVAHGNPYHPVREYLSGLTWDGTQRLGAACEDLLGAERSELNQAILTRWFVSAVARAIRPGCKVDTVLILVGDQGALKSTWFATLAAPWFVDSAVDLSDKDSYQVLRRAWIYEWAELEVLRRTKDAATAKAFLSSSVDTYRPSYGRLVVDVPRGCVIVGSTNNDEFLSDYTGNRRFWPVRVGKIDIESTAAQRDQLWAEAMRLYSSGERWWLDGSELEWMEGRHEEHVIRDAWEEVVLSWTARQSGPVTTADVLRGALEKPTGQWSRADEMRVARVLRMHGWSREVHGGERNRQRYWRRG